MSEFKNAKSPAGTVHIVTFEWENKVETLCHHYDYYKGWAGGFEHEWERTDESVTCKTCLKMSGNDQNKDNIKRKLLLKLTILLKGSGIRPLFILNSIWPIIEGKLR